ncbi:UBP1-associated proteins 1C isoform X1 [Carica papaya]|uniref:UBP1-associated proteins 1C isoform X1 n=1 Tax=Carica papaya TaxID=3649 RepID=UPI000B8CA010|nr:UBP1-associated proteins 1C isoform X1 [Carica papaya]
MVWFQCEDCGENLKKPKLPNHFRICSASKLSCIDCGEIFGQQSVQGHTQCITEAEKYGPKGQAKPLNGTTAKPNKDSKQHPDFDINVGLSERPPWFCSLCNTKTTSKQTLLLHADGKKHRAKARAFHAKQQPEETEESVPDMKVPTENASKAELLDNKHLGNKVDGLSKSVPSHGSSDVGNGDLTSNKKRKLDAPRDDGTQKKSGNSTSNKVGDGEVIQVEKVKTEEESRIKKAKYVSKKEDEVVQASKDIKKKDIKWKKLIMSALKSNPDGVLKMRKLRKLVLKSLQESGVADDEAQLSDKLEHKINSSARFTIDGKYVRLVASD